MSSVYQDLTCRRAQICKMACVIIAVATSVELAFLSQGILIGLLAVEVFALGSKTANYSGESFLGELFLALSVLVPFFTGCYFAISIQPESNPFIQNAVLCGSFYCVLAFFSYMLEEA